MLNFYNVRMKNGDDECWTGCEAKSEKGAIGLTNLKWGRPWRAQEAKLSKPFYQELYAGTEEEVAALLELRVANLKKGISKPVITPQGEYPSVKDAAAAHNQKIDAFRKRLGRDPGFYYKSSEH